MPPMVTRPTRRLGETVLVIARTRAEPLPTAGAGVVLRTISQSLSLVAVHAQLDCVVTAMFQLASPTPTVNAVLSSEKVQTGAGGGGALAQLVPQPLCVTV